jgi:hypothetical protein
MRSAARGRADWSGVVPASSGVAKAISAAPANRRIYPRTVTSAPLPDATTRWRCARCGNLTRFDVTRRSRTREFLHLDLAGGSVVEEREVLDEVVESVRCRWCDGVDTVELVPRPDGAAEVGPDPVGTDIGSDPVRAPGR